MYLGTKNNNSQKEVVNPPKIMVFDIIINKKSSEFQRISLIEAGCPFTSGYAGFDAFNNKDTMLQEILKKYTTYAKNNGFETVYMVLPSNAQLLEKQIEIVKKTGITHVDVSKIEKEGFKKNSLVLTTMIPFLLKERLSKNSSHKFENVRFVDDDNLIPAISGNKVFLATCLKQAKYIPKTITLSLHANEKEYCVKRLEILMRQTNSSHYILKLSNASYGNGALVVRKELLIATYNILSHNSFPEKNIKDRLTAIMTHNEIKDYKKANKELQMAVDQQYLFWLKQRDDKAEVFLIQPLQELEVEMLEDKEHHAITRVVVCDNGNDDIDIMASWKRLVQKPNEGKLTTQECVTTKVPEKSIKRFYKPCVIEGEVKEELLNMVTDVVKRCSQSSFTEINNQVLFGNDPVLKNVKQRKIGQLTKKLEVLNLSSNNQAYVNKLSENNTKKETRSVELHLDLGKSLPSLNKN